MFLAIVLVLVIIIIMSLGCAPLACATIVGSGIHMNRAHMHNVDGNSAPPTYTIFGIMGDAPIQFLIDEMDKHGFRRVINPRAHQLIDVVWTSMGREGRFDPLSFNIPCRVKNVTDDRSYSVVENKKLLHLSIAREDKRAYDLYFARTKQMDKFKYPRIRENEDGDSCGSGPVFILRPSGLGFYSGQDIMRVCNALDFERAKKYYARKHIPLYNVIVSEYFDEPYLWKGRKFHLRLYMLVRADPKFRASDSWELWRDDDPTRPRGKILTAAKPYVRGNYDDNDIHDTHAKSTSEALFFPTHANEIRAPSLAALSQQHYQESEERANLREIYAQLEDICATIARQLERANLRPYAESHRAFDIFGLDVMIVRTIARPLSVILIEVNDRVGYATCNDPLSDVFFRDFFAWAYERGVKPLLYGGKEDTDEGREC